MLAPITSWFELPITVSNLKLQSAPYRVTAKSGCILNRQHPSILTRGRGLRFLPPILFNAPDLTLSHKIDTHFLHPSHSSPVQLCDVPLIHVSDLHRLLSRGPTFPQSASPVETYGGVKEPRRALPGPRRPFLSLRLPFFSPFPTAQQAALPGSLHRNKKTKNAKGALKNGRLYPRASRAEGEMPSPCFSQAEGISFPSFPQCHLASKCSQALFHDELSSTSGLAQYGALLPLFPHGLAAPVTLHPIPPPTVLGCTPVPFWLLQDGARRESLPTRIQACSLFLGCQSSAFLDAPL